MRKCAAKPYEGKEKYIFVSYCHRDRAQVFPIIEQLAKEGYRIWYDEGIDPGSEWPEIIAKKLNGAAICIAFITVNALNSHNCRREINFALLKKKFFISVILEPVEMTLGMEMQLSSAQSIFKYKLSSNKDFFTKLYEAKELENCKGEPNYSIEVSSPSDYADELNNFDKIRDPFSDRWFIEGGKPKSEQENDGTESRKAEEAKKAEEARKAAEEAKKAEEARKAAEEAKKAEEARKAAEEAKKAEEARKAAEEAKKAEEARKAAEEAKKAEEARKAAEEAKKAEEARKAAEEAKKAEEARKAAEEAKKAEEARKAAEEAKKAEEARKAAEEAKKAEEARKAAEEAKKAEEARKAAEEAKKAEEARKAAEEAKKAEEARKAEEAEIRRKAEEAQKAAEEAKKKVVINSIHMLKREKTNEIIKISKTPFKIGRSNNVVDYVITDNKSISRSHATLIIKNDACYIIDNGSLNGTYVNGNSIIPDEEKMLKNGDRIKLYNEQFTYLKYRG